jgi:uncharacterized protein (DUF1800 family)
MENSLDLNRIASEQTIWLYRMLHTARPLEEKMTLFWHNHFATSNTKVANAPAMYAQNQFLRANAMGSFRDLVAGISRDPAMIRWLDGNTNRKASPNENYARELMELFTMGVDTYTQADVKEAARAFTGWFFDRNQGFVFNRNQHDDGEKTFFGQTGPWGGDDIIGMILDRPVTAEFMARKVFTFFVHGHPEPSTVGRLADGFRGSGYSVRELVRSVLKSPEFSSAEAYHAVIKSPVDFLIGAMKALGVTEFARGAPASLQRMGMSLFNPPDVSGWEWGADWIGSATLLERLNAANGLTTARGDAAPSGMDPAVVGGRMGTASPEQLVDGMLNLLVDGDVPPQTRKSLIDYVAGAGRLSPGSAAFDRSVRGVAHLIMATPVYQMA